MTANTQHTPGPFSAIGVGVYSEYGLLCDAEASGERGIDDAAFIARACNAHDELLAACVALIHTDDLQHAIDLARAAIAKVQS